MGIFSRKKPSPESLPTEPSTPALDTPVVFIDRKELYETGFEFCGPEISAAFAQAGLQITLDDQRQPPPGVEVDESGLVRWLWVNEQFLIEHYGHDVEFQLADGQLAQTSALDWDFVMALRAAFSSPTEPELNWQLGLVDEGYLLVLARPSDLATVDANSAFPGYGVVDLTGAVEVRRGPDL